MFGKSTQRLLRMDRTVRSYLVERLLPMIGSEIGACRMSVPLDGLNAFARIVQTDDGRGVVVRVFPKSARKHLRDRQATLGLLRDNGVAVPEVVDYVENFSKSGVCFYTKQFIEGHTLAHTPLDPATIPQLAALMAPLHKAKSTAWGEPKRPQSGSFANYEQKQALGRLRSIRKHLRRGTATLELAKIAEWFESEKYRLMQIDEFNLTHNDINPGNLLWSEGEGRYYLLDLGLLRYGARARDLVNLHHRVLASDAERIAEFQRIYGAAFSEAQRRITVSVWRWYHACYHLRCAASHIRRLSKISTASVGENLHYENFLHNWERLQRIVNAQGGLSPLPEPESTDARPQPDQPAEGAT
jgi:aminoglycoside phosphotransferase (APT) family kinase protein